MNEPGPAPAPHQAAGSSRIRAASPAKVLFVVESATDVRLVDGLAERFEVSVLARRFLGSVEINAPPRTNVPIEIAPPSRLGFARLVFSKIRRESFEFVLVQGYSVAALAANLAARASGVPAAMLVCSPQEAYYLCRREHARPGKPFRSRELFALRTLARINAWVGSRHIVISDHLATIVRSHGSRRVDVVPVYGVDRSVFRPAEESRASLKRRLGLPESGTLVFFSSRFAPEKDAETLLEAVRRLIAKGRDLWLLHRSGMFREFLEYAERMGIAGRVVATDAVDPRELAPDYQASDLCVQASREEGLGFSPLEALACRTPVIAARVGGLVETIVEGRTGWSYRVGDVDDLCRALEEAMDDPAEAERRADVGRAMVDEKFDHRSAFDRLEAIVEESRTAP